MARQGRPYIRCHSEERSDEESREQDSQRNHTGSFAGAQDDSMFWDVLPLFRTFFHPKYPFFGLYSFGKPDYNTNIKTEEKAA